MGFTTEEPLAGLPRVAPKGGVTIGGTYFPQGVTLTVNPSVIHNSKEIWGPDAREFNPDRWLRPDAAEKEKCFIPVSLQKSLPTKDHLHDPCDKTDSRTQWGAGYASCPGQHAARLQLSKIAATVVRDYNMRQVDPKQEWTWGAWFTCVPHDWPVYIEKCEESE